MRRIYFYIVCAILLFFSCALSAQEADTDETRKRADERVQIAMSSPDYMVTAGDVYLLSYAIGSTPVSYSIPVDNTYEIKVSNLAAISGQGKTFLQLKKEVERIVSRNYPMGGVCFTLLQPAVFSVFIKGEVKTARTEKAWAMTRLGDVLTDCMTNWSSLRHVAVISKSGKKNVYDLYKCYADGDFSQNPYLRPDDTIEITRYDRKISIEGAVYREGAYELLPGEQILELIEIYGGGTLSRADLSRVDISRSEDTADFSSRKLCIGAEEISENFTLLDNDSVFIHSFDELKPVVFVEGAVVVSQDNAELVSGNRRAVIFEKDEDYAVFARRNENLISRTADVENAYVLRGDKRIQLNLKRVLYDAEAVLGVTPEKYDVLMLPFKQSFVTVAGAVNRPGRYPYIPDRTWDYYIGLAGGFNKIENYGEIITIRDINNRKVSKKGFITPESTLTAVSNAPTYYFNIYAPIVTTLLTTVSTVFTIIAVTR